MEINANISATVATSISKLNLNTTNRSFEAKKNNNQEKNPEIVEEFSETKTEPIPDKVSVDVEDIKKYAKYMGENLSIDDINYGLRYGRSVIADYSV